MLRTRVRPIRRTVVITLLLVVDLSKWLRLASIPLLLLAAILSVVNADCHSDIIVKYVGSVL